MVEVEAVNKLPGVLDDGTRAITRAFSQAIKPYNSNSNCYASGLRFS